MKKREKVIIKGLSALDSKMELVERLERGEKVKGYHICPQCKGSGFEKDSMGMCKICLGDGFIKKGGKSGGKK